MKLKILLISLCFISRIASSASSNDPISGLPPEVLDLLNSSNKIAVSNILSIHIEAATNWYKGLPYFVTVTVKNEGPEPITLTEWNPIPANLPLSAHLVSANGDTYSSTVNRFGFIRGEVDTNRGSKPIYEKTLLLAGGESVRSIANLASFGSVMSKLDPPTGVYRFSVPLWKEHSGIIGESQAIDITVRERPNQELSTLKSVSNLTAHASELKQSIALEDLQKIKSKDLRETLAFCSLLRDIGTAKDISAIRVGGYKQVIGPWALPELEEIEYEVLLAQGNKNQANLARDTLLRRFPAMKYWADGAQGDGGLCRTIRGMHAYGR